MKKSKIINKCIKLIDRLINFITTVFFILILLFGAYALYDAYHVYDGARLSDEIMALRPLDEEAEFSLDNLLEINKDICGWIRIDDTYIDYPIVIGKDNSEYLNIDYKKEYSTAGSVFMDYRNERDFSDDYTIIYGHNMHGDLMFGDMKKFSDKEYFDEHKTGTLFTSSGVYHIEVLCIANVSAYSDEVYNLLLYKNNFNQMLINNFNKIGSIKRELTFEKGSKLLLLSTCNAAGSNERIVLATKITKKDASDIINEGNTSALGRIENEKDNKNANENAIEQSEFVPVKKPPKKLIIDLSRRTLMLIGLSIIVVIIFIILIIKRIRANKKIENTKDSDKNEEKEKKIDTKSKNNIKKGRKH